VETPPRFQAQVLGLFRIVLGLLFACHGAATLFGVLGGGHGLPPTPGQWPGWWAAVIQLAGGALVLLGLGTRPAALLCSGSMAYAYFVHHQPDGLFPLENGGESAALFCWAFLLIAALGPGRWTVTELPALAGRLTHRNREEATTRNRT
jgi:putative oxidoreductase